MVVLSKESKFNDLTSLLFKKVSVFSLHIFDFKRTTLLNKESFSESETGRDKTVLRYVSKESVKSKASLPKEFKILMNGLSSIVLKNAKPINIAPAI